MLKFIEFRHIQYQPKLWYFILFFLTLLIGVIFSIYVSHAQDEEMRDNLITYTNTIEQSIDWKPFAATLNVNPNQIKSSDLVQLEVQLKNACKANSECHFIYLLYQDNNQVKFLLDASPQPPSEISQLGDVFVEASTELKHVMNTRKPYVEGPVTDHWVLGSVHGFLSPQPSIRLIL